MRLKMTDIKPYDNLSLIAKQVVNGFITGLHRSPYHGFSVEFAEHKPYDLGESTQHIDWKVFARTEKLFTKQYEEETNLRCHLLVDHSASMHYPHPEKDKLRFAVFAAASIAYLLTQQRDAVGLTLFSDKVDFETAQKSTKGHLASLLKTLSALATQKPEGVTDIPNILHQMADKARKRSLIVILSDMFYPTEDEALFTALQHLKHQKHEVILFHISDHKHELEFDFQDRPYKLIDIETQEALKVNPSEIREAYRSSVSSFYEKLWIKCGSMKVDFVSVDTQDPFDKVLAAYLIKRQKMR